MPIVLKTTVTTLNQFCCLSHSSKAILIIAPSVTALQSIVYMCERELNRLDLLVNVKKSCCMRVGPHWVRVMMPVVLRSYVMTTRHFNGLIVLDT